MRAISHFIAQLNTYWDTHPLLCHIIAWVGFFVAGAILAFPSLSYDWFNDDLTLIQSYSAEHIARGLQGNYLPADDLGTLGYRPLTVLYYHSIGSLSGENTAIARLLQISFFSLALSVMIGAAHAAGTPASVALFAALLGLTFRNTWWMLTWPTDGVRNLMLLCGAAALWSGICLAKNSRFVLGLLCIIFYTLAIFTREEALVFAAIIPLSSWAVTKKTRLSIALAVGCAAISVIFFLLRASFVPNAPRITGVDFTPFLILLFYMYAPRLFEPLPMWVGIVTILLVWTTALFRPPGRAWLWLLISAIALAPNIVVGRANNLFLSLVFLALFFAESLASPLKTATWSRWLSVGAAVLLLLGNIVSHRLAQNTLAPDSADRVWQAREFLYGEWQYALDDIPPQRLESLYRAAGEQNPQFLTRWLNGGW